MLHLVVGAEPLGRLRPGVVAGGANGLVGVLGPDHRLLLLLTLELGLPQLPLQRLYRGRHDKPFPFLPAAPVSAFYSNLEKGGAPVA
jgi:hypothetical protein